MYTSHMMNSLMQQVPGAADGVAGYGMMNMGGGMLTVFWVSAVLLWGWLATGIVAMVVWMMRKK